MPVVQRYGGRRVGTTPLPGARKTAAETEISEGAGLARAKAETALAAGEVAGILGRLGTGRYAQIRAKEKLLADNTAGLEAETALVGWGNRRLYTDENAAYKMRGKDALGLPETVLEEFDREADRIAQGLANDEQRAAFAKVRAGQRQQIDLGLRRHVLNEMQATRTQALQAFVETMSSSAIAAAQDPKAVVAIMQRVTQAIRDGAADAGLRSPEAVDQAVLGAQSHIHVGVIRNLLSLDRAGEAQAYYDDIAKGEIVGEDVGDVEQALKAGTVRKASQDLTDQIMTKATTFEEAMEMVREATKGDKDRLVRDEASRRVRQRWEEKETGRRLAQEALSRDAKTYIDEHQTWEGYPHWADLDPDTASRMTAYASAITRQVPIRTDQAVYYELSKMASADITDERRVAFLQMDLYQFVDRLSLEDFKHFVDAQGAGRQGDLVKLRALMTNVAAQNDIVDEALISMGMDPTPPQPGTSGWSQKKADRVNTFRRVVREAVQREEQILGRKLTDPELQKKVDELRMQTGVTSRWYSRDLPVFAFEAGAQISDVSQIPAAERASIEAGLRAKHLPLDSRRLIEAYNFELAVRRGEKERPPDEE